MRERESEQKSLLGFYVKILHFFEIWLVSGVSCIIKRHKGQKEEK